MPSPARATQFAALPLWLAGGNVVVALLIMGLVSLAIVQSRLQFQHQAEVEAENLARVLQEHITSVIDKADLSLRTLAADVRMQPPTQRGIDAAALNTRLAQQQALQAELTGLRATDAEGIVRYGAGIPTGKKISLHDRGYFTRARDDSAEQLIIDGPIVSRITHKPMLVLARRLSRADGTFAGVVYATIQAENFQKILASPDLHAKGLATLLTGAGQAIARHPAVEEAASLGAQNPPLTFLTRLRTHPERAHYVAVSVIDNVQRTFAYHRLAHQPLYVIVGLARADYLEDWGQQALRFAALAALVIVIAAFASWFVYRAWLQQCRAVASKDKSARALRLLSDCNALLMQARNEQELLDKVCRIVVETGGYLMAWVGYAQNDSEKTVQPVAQSGYEDSYLSRIRVVWSDVELGRGPTGSAVREGTTQINRDVTTNPRMLPWRQEALVRGYRSSIALPLLSGRRSLGALTLYAREAQAFVAEEVRLLEELAANLSYGIAVLRARALHAAAQGELDQHRRRLEELVAQRTSELGSAKDEAERANNAKSRFLAATSHDLRQPVAALSLYVDSLGRKRAVPDAKLLANMRECTDSLNAMLADLMQLSQLDAGVIKPVVGYFALEELLSRVLATHAPEASHKGLALRCRRSSLRARSDAVLYQRIVGNLVCNAIRYTEQGGVLVAVRRRQGRPWIEVWDTGIGIDADKTVEIFEEFHQIGNPAHDADKGTGLGLAIVAKTAALLGLQVRVHSRPGRGSLFAVELPLAGGEKVAVSGSAGADPAYPADPTDPAVAKLFQ